MKKILPLALLILAASCEEQMEVPTDGRGDLLVMCASLSSADDTHTVMVVKSTEGAGTLQNADGTTVRIYVNGNLADECGTPDKDKSFTLRATFSAGDTVRVTADCGSLHAESEQTVPEAPVLTDARADGTTEMSYYDYGNVSHKLFTKILTTVQDPAGVENRYRLSMSLSAEMECVRDLHLWEYDPDRTGEKQSWPRKDLPIYNMMEPAMTPGWTSDVTNNNFNLVSDKTFDGQQQTLALLTDGKFYLSWSYGGGETWVIRKWINVRVESLSEQAYRYLLAVEYDSNGPWIPLSYSPTVFPCNVKGGLGYVSVASAVEIPVRLEDEYIGEPL